MNQSYTKIDGKVYQKSKVVMRPTTDTKAYIWKTPHQGLIRHPPLAIAYMDAPQHLYFLSDELIRKGDIYFDFSKSFILTALGTVPNTEDKRFKKILASTDKSLGLPHPSDGFLKAYCEAGGIDEVLIEYELVEDKDDLISLGSDGSGDNFYGTKRVLKIAPDNTITIKSVKESWNREEIKALFHKFSNVFGGHYTSEKNINIWLERNL